jgi:hypothetical protein
MDDYCKKSKVPETAMFKPQQQYRRCVAETFKVFPPSAVVLIDSLLSLEPEVRGTASSALQSDVSFICYHKNHFLLLWKFNILVLPV